MKWPLRWGMMTAMARSSELATPSATRGVLERFGLSPKKALGQNFLVNDDVVRRILELSELGPEDTALEVGPGIGTLTFALLSHARAVISVERDDALTEVLSFTLQPFKERFRLVRKDALDLKGADLGSLQPNKLIANLPYNVAATVVLDYVERFACLESATVMVQREVAERMCASVGTKDYGAYTVKLRLRMVPAGQFAVSRNDFMPPPHVDSTVIRLDRRHDLPEWAGPACIQAASMMADAAFASRRKTIMNSCKSYFAGRGASGARVMEALPDILQRANVDPRVRGERLTPEDYLHLGASVTLEHI